MKTIHKRMRSLLILTFLLKCVFYQAQTRSELISKLKSSPDDTNKVFSYISIGQLYESDLPDSALYYYEKSRVLSEKLSYKFGTLKYIANVTYVLHHKEKHDEALKLNLQSLALAKEINNKDRICAAYSNIASSYNHMGQYEKATDNYLQALKIAEELNNKGHCLIIALNLCGLYNGMKLYDESLHYGEMSISIANQVETSAQNKVAALTNNAAILTQKADYIKAEKYYNEALEISKKENLYYELALTYNGFADLKISKKDFTNLKDVYELVKINAEKANNLRLIVRSEIGMGIHHYYNKNNITAQTFLQRGTKIAEQNKLQDILLTAYEYSSYNEAALKNIDAALLYNVKLDSIEYLEFNENAKRTARDLEAKYETEKKEKKILEQSLILEKRNNYIKLLGLGLITALLTGYSIYNNSKKKRKIQEQEMLTAKADANAKVYLTKIETQNYERQRIAKDLHDSIGGTISSIGMYAEVAMQRIQKQQDAIEPLRKISDTISEVMDDVKDTIWFIVPESQNFTSVIDRLRQYGEPLCRDKNVAFDIQYDPDDKLNALDMFEKKDTYLICKEAINNALKYSNATSIAVKAHIENNIAQISVEDNGKGFELASAFGNGLQNMKERAKKLNGTISFDTKDHTHIMLSFAIQ
jgi:two-component system, NarL family, sensor kinase